MSKTKNILFIMADQLRWDYLSCAGHKTLKTPTIDALAARGTRFTNAYVQSAICGPSRVSFYTGRYVTSHGATWNQIPLSVGEWGLGDYLRPLGLRVALAGKTHMVADMASMEKLSIEPDSYEGILTAQAGFEPYIRDDGLHPDQLTNPDLAYNQYLRNQGYDGENPWHSWANAAEGENGEILSGWYMRNCNKPARIKAEHSETPWMTDQAMKFMEEQGDEPWCLHLSYIKPHWPYMAPEPYFSNFSKNDIPKANRQDHELDNPHPVVKAFMNHAEGRNFAREETRETVIPAYMALIQQLDDELARLFGFMEKNGRLDDTLIVFTSDHGDYLGDHWLGEKELFHDCSTKIPLIIAGPDLAEGQVIDELVEAIDLIPTFVDSLGGSVPNPRLEGRSLLQLLKDGKVANWRDYAICELDYSHRGARLELGLDVNSCKAWMVRSENWKYIHYLGYPAQLFDMVSDPLELNDLGQDPAFANIREEFAQILFDWHLSGRKVRKTISDQEVEARTDSWQKKGVIFGEW
ncbi:sulfatase-like hydrolase/transferase [Curvivirga sp.]|uniref:sulfatase-like hydrolase/transferase n=1 Tax=Curvivirga sp. TaxID=2856848 RepID=UPI003B5AF9C2